MSNRRHHVRYGPRVPEGTEPADHGPATPPDDSMDRADARVTAWFVIGFLAFALLALLLGDRPAPVSAEDRVRMNLQR